MNRQMTAWLLARHALAAAAAAAFLAAPAAGATQKDAAPRISASSSAAPAKATRAEIPLPPPPAGTRIEHRGATLGIGVGPWLAFGTGDSVAAQLDYGFPRTPVGWGRFELEYRLAVVLARPSADTTLTRTVAAPFTFTTTQIETGVKKTRVWLVEAVPTARVRYPMGPKFALIADGGLGVAQTIERYVSDETYVGRTTKTRNVTGLALRLGGGASLDLGERLRLVLLPVALSLHLGPGYGAYAPTVGIAYRM